MLLVFFLAGCSHNGPKAPAAGAPSLGSVKQYRQVPPFSEVDVQGRVNITLHTGYKKPEVILSGDPRDLAQVRTVVTTSALYINLGTGYPRYGSVHADIRGQTLDRVRYVGAGFVTGSQLNTRFLDLYLQNQGTTKLAGNIGLQTLEVVGSGLTQIKGIYSNHLQINLKGNPKVQLTGFARLAKLDISGDAWLSLYWIKSDNLKIIGRKAAKIQLGGMVNRLEVELWGTAQFKGRYLRAHRSFVRTHDKSVAEIATVKHQSNLATDASDIYYFNLPTTRADFMAFNGSVLDMRDWNDPEIVDFTLYNKQFP
jgi:hypothetical protein